MRKIKEEDWKFVKKIALVFAHLNKIPKQFANPKEIDKLNIVWVLDNEMNSKLLQDRKSSLELDEDETKIRDFIDEDEVILINTFDL